MTEKHRELFGEDFMVETNNFQPIKQKNLEPICANNVLRFYRSNLQTFAWIPVQEISYVEQLSSYTFKVVTKNKNLETSVVTVHSTVEFMDKFFLGTTF